ncbi:MAG: tetratricopeptide repeat protein [Alphaproteobacteria bacterium]|nr:tetratricopeptide repeat protein [Alphaproteobacteria bacterium]
MGWGVFRKLADLFKTSSRDLQGQMPHPALEGLEDMINRGRSLHGQGRYEEAMKVAEQISDLNLDEASTAFPSNFLMYQCLHDQGKFIEALPYLEKATEKSRNTAFTQFQLAELHNQIGNGHKALIHALQASELGKKQESGEGYP